MTELIHAQLHGFRSITRTQYVTLAHCNILTGANGSGKTALFEALHLAYSHLNPPNPAIPELYETNVLEVHQAAVSLQYDNEADPVTIAFQTTHRDAPLTPTGVSGAGARDPDHFRGSQFYNFATLGAVPFTGEERALPNRLTHNGSNLPAHLRYLKRKHPGIYNSIVDECSAVSPTIFSDRPTAGHDHIATMPSGHLRLLAVITALHPIPEYQGGIIAIENGASDLSYPALQAIFKRANSPQSPQNVIVSMSDRLIDLAQDGHVLVASTDGRSTKIRSANTRAAEHHLERGFSMSDIVNQRLFEQPVPNY